MKVKFSQRLNTKISIYSILIVLFIFIAGGVGLCSLGYPLLKDFHELRLSVIVSERALAIDSALRHYKRDLDNFSRLSIVRDDVAILLKGERRAIYGPLLRAWFLEEKVSIGRHEMFAVLSKEGRVIASSKDKIIGEDWSGKDFFKHLVTKIRETIVVAIHPPAAGETVSGAAHDISFLTPIFDVNKDVMALLYTIKRGETLRDLLKIERGLYKSAKIRLIDMEGNIVIAKEGMPGNIIRDAEKDTGGYKDGMFFYVADLKSVPLQLIGTVDKSAVTESFIILLIIYLSVGGAIILIIIVQNSYLAPRLTAGPASRPVNEVESQPKTFVKVPHELKAMLNSIVSNAEMAASREVLLWPNKKGLEDILTDAKGMLLLIESLQYLSMIESGQKAISPEGFILCDLIGEIEVIAKDLIGTKEIELIADCDALLSDKPIYTDRGSLKNLLVSLVSNAIRHTDVGTITLLSVKEMIDGTEQIEITIADTGKGIKPEALKQEADASLYHPEFSGLAIAKRLAAAIDGKIEGESIADRGSVLTAIIPLKKQKNGSSPNLVKMR